MTHEQLAIAVASILAPFFISFVKKVLRWEGNKAYWLAFILSVLIAVITGIATGRLPELSGDPIAFVNALAAYFGVIFAVAQACYKILTTGLLGLKVTWLRTRPEAPA